MIHQYSDNLCKILICPFCDASLASITNEGAVCEGCHAIYRYSKSGPLDLRLNKPKIYQYNFHIDNQASREANLTQFNLLEIPSSPEVDYSDIPIPSHLSKQIVSHFPKAKSKDSLALDLGCGSTIHRNICEHAGFEYVGLDYDSPRAAILGDAHSLPFKDNSFEFVLSIAVLEHIQFPFVMTKEVHRVLKPKGIFIGTVAFLEPFHGNSFYHHTHLGTFTSLKASGFKILHIAPNEKWPVLIAQANMGLFPRMPRLISSSLVLPIQALHVLWWKIGSLFSRKINDHNRVLKTSGAFIYIATK